jgi:uncharacterized protein YjiS (DUF1127 family)
MQYGLLAKTEISTDRSRRAALLRFLAQLPARIEIRNEIAARYDALTRLSDEQLAEIGIERDDVPRIAVLGAHG